MGYATRKDAWGGSAPPIYLEREYVMSELKVEIFAWVIIILLFIGTLTGIFYLKYITCGNKAELMGLEYNFAIFQGCMIKPKNGNWVPLDNYRQF